VEPIPRILHRIWVGAEPLPAAAERFADSWTHHHPGWQMRLWTDASLPSHLVNREICEQTAHPAQRADVLRHEILNLFGGVYIDVDFECFRPIEPLLEGVGYFYGDEREGRAGTAILGCTPGHPFARWCLERLPEHWPWTQGSILEETGPVFFERAVASYAADAAEEPLADPLTGRHAGTRLMPPQRPPLHVFAPWVFFPYWCGETWRPEDHTDSYAAHHWQKNWEF